MILDRPAGAPLARNRGAASFVPADRVHRRRYDVLLDGPKSYRAAWYWALTAGAFRRAATH
jgi:hypothetical protein